MDYSRLIILIGAILSLGAITSCDEAPDCNAGLEDLLQHVNKPNVTSTDCKDARKSIQTLLQTCEASDPAGYVITTMDFARHYADGQVCANTQGPVTKCHDVPSCYKMVVGADNKYSCGDNNSKAEKSLKCFQEQIDAGCHLAPKLLGFNQAAAKKFCNYEQPTTTTPSSSTREVASAAAITIALFVVGF